MTTTLCYNQTRLLDWKSNRCEGAGSYCSPKTQGFELPQSLKWLSGHQRWPAMTVFLKWVASSWAGCFSEWPTDFPDPGDGKRSILSSYTQVTTLKLEVTDSEAVGGPVSGKRLNHKTGHNTQTIHSSVLKTLFFLFQNLRKNCHLKCLTITALVSITET